MNIILIILMIRFTSQLKLDYENILITKEIPSKDNFEKYFEKEILQNQHDEEKIS